MFKWNLKRLWKSGNEAVHREPMPCVHFEEDGLLRGQNTHPHTAFNCHDNCFLSVWNVKFGGCSLFSLLFRRDRMIVLKWRVDQVVPLSLKTLPTPSVTLGINFKFYNMAPGICLAWSCLLLLKMLHQTQTVHFLKHSLIQSSLVLPQICKALTHIRIFSLVSKTQALSSSQYLTNFCLPSALSPHVTSWLLWKRQLSSPHLI